MVIVGAQRKENCLLTTGLCVADESHASRVQRIAKIIVSRFGLYTSGCTEGGHKDAQYYCGIVGINGQPVHARMIKVGVQSQENCLLSEGYRAANAY